MAADLPTDWLAKTLDSVDDEARRWPQGLKDSYRHLTGNEIGPDPRDQRIADLEDALRSLVADCDDYAQKNNLAGTWATIERARVLIKSIK